ncbi:hypothetical protein DdX_15232 [Ditylenchus destructor]|uniref:Ubiquitin-like domain-containing protein n=1 Tax=Ditylenchus destructor TaxID=166010 RepID=A0AAD4MT68_9BILA|nr:hypothetical protein DdX_15232 [Ditylenchus destructor]
MNNPALFVRIMWTNTKPVFRFSEPPFTIDKIRDWVGTRTSVPRDNVKLTKYNPINGIYPELLDGFSIEQYNLPDENTIRAWLRNEKGFDGKEKVGVKESGSNEQALDIAKVDPKGGSDIFCFLNGTRQKEAGQKRQDCRPKKTRFWTHPIFANRKKFGAYYVLLPQLKADDDKRIALKMSYYRTRVYYTGSVWAWWIIMLIICCPCLLLSIGGVGIYFCIRNSNKRRDVGYTQGYQAQGYHGQAGVVVSNV